MDDLDTYRAAKLVLDKHGDGAEWHCLERMVALANERDMAGVDAWRLILAAMKELRRREPSMGERIH